MNPIPTCYRTLTPYLAVPDGAVSPEIGTASSMDPFGHRWAVCTKIEDVPADEVASRARELSFSDAAS